MNAKDFLDLVDKHPLPWGCLGYDEGDVYYVKPTGGRVKMDCHQELADHAPQMAAAILRALADRRPHENETRAIPHGYVIDANLLRALRDSLPKDLRP